MVNPGLLVNQRSILGQLLINVWSMCGEGLINLRAVGEQTCAAGANGGRRTAASRGQRETDSGAAFLFHKQQRREQPSVGASGT